MTAEQAAQDARLDEWLDAYAVSIAPGDPLVARIVASAALAAGGTPAAPPAVPRWRWLWPGAGLAGIGLAGSLAGALAVSVTLGAANPRAVPDWPERLSAFSEPSPDWSEE
jgi:hypothetical protein